MKILVSCLGYDSGKSGISVYMRNVVKWLESPRNDITLVVESDASKDFGNAKKIVVPRFFSKSLMGYLWHIFALPLIAKNYDCLLVLAGNRRFCPFGIFPKVGVVHDLSQYHVRSKYGALRMFQLMKIQPVLGKTFDAIAAISLSTKEDISMYWGVPPEQIELNYNGISPATEPDYKILGKLGLDKYILYVSRIEHPAKNHVGLIKAFESLPSEIGKDYKLVFVGQDWNGAETVRRTARDSSRGGNIVFTGFVSDGELSALYQKASLFVFPSLAEGFGLGLVEAMSRGIPCACSNVAALAEVGGDAVLQFNPRDTGEMAAAVSSILQNRDLSRKLSLLGIERAKMFSWRAHAEKLLELCRKVSSANDSVKIFGIPFFNGRMNDVVEMLAKRAERKLKTSVAFVNTHYLNCAYENAEQRARLRKFNFVFPDGVGVKWACRILDEHYRDNLNGTDMLPNLCRIACRKNLSLFFLGGREGVAARAAENLKSMFQGLNVVGTESGYFDDTEKTITLINERKPDFLFVGLGAGLQEKWVVENIDRLDCAVAFAIGGVCDVYSGDLKRNPVLRRLGLEWFGRLLQEPVRLFGRYVAGNPLFCIRVFAYKFFGKCGYGKDQ